MLDLPFLVCKAITLEQLLESCSKLVKFPPFDPQFLIPRNKQLQSLGYKIIVLLPCHLPSTKYLSKIINTIIININISSMIINTIFKKVDINKFVTNVVKKWYNSNV